MVVLASFLGLKKEEIKNTLSLILRDLPILFYSHPVSTPGGLAHMEVQKLWVSVKRFP